MLEDEIHKDNLSRSTAHISYLLGCHWREYSCSSQHYLNVFLSFFFLTYAGHIYLNLPINSYMVPFRIQLFLDEGQNKFLTECKIGEVRESNLMFNHSDFSMKCIFVLFSLCMISFPFLFTASLKALWLLKRSSALPIWENNSYFSLQEGKKKINGAYNPMSQPHML